MIAFNIELLIIAFFLLLLFFISLVEYAIAQASPVTMRMLVEHPDNPESPFLASIIEDKTQILIPLHFGRQFSVITISILVTHLSLQIRYAQGLLAAFLFSFLFSVVFCQLLPRLLTQHNPEQKLLSLLRFFEPLYSVLSFLSKPITQALNSYKIMHEKVESSRPRENEEATDEEVQAYLEIGENEGILQEEDTKLIQSVVEFGNTLVREVMTPRTKIVACEEKSTIGELRETMVRNRHSRIPVYREDIDHIVGVAYIRRLMAEYVKGSDSDPISRMINPVLFVPGSKPVSKLMKELQERGDHLAIVIDEFGGVAGLVTIEDLIEEIIGEIRDEDEAKVSKIIEEGPRTFVVRGSAELSRLEELAGISFEDSNYSTVAGLVMAYLGRVPAPGETFDMNGISVRILDADRKRVYWLRMQLPEIKTPTKE